MRRFGFLALVLATAFAVSSSVRAATLDLTFTQDSVDLSKYVVDATLTGPGDLTTLDFFVDNNAGATWDFTGTPWDAGFSNVGTDGTRAQIDLQTGLQPAINPGAFLAGTLTVVNALQGGAAGTFGPETLLDRGGASVLDVNFDGGDVIFGFYPAFGNSFEDIPVRVTIVNVPEPGTLVLLGAGLAGLAFLRRRSVA
ncbi:MAG: PEP-CTERM sorting domain-containing protein [Planctomycetota bacterium]|jgi:hypothetical protein